MTTARRVVLCVFGAALAHAALAAQQPPPDRFRYERPVSTTGQGPHRLAVDVPLLAGAEPFVQDRALAPSRGLSDLRLFAADGTAVPYLLLRPPSRAPVWSAGQVLPIPVTEKTSGFEADFGVAGTIDAIRVSGLPRSTLKRLRLDGSGDREHWTVLVLEGTLFNLPDEGLVQNELTFPAGAFRYLRVTWNDTNSGRVPLPAVEARQVIGVVPPVPLTASLPVERRPSEPGRSRYRVRLPAARLPVTAVALDVPVAEGAHVFRQAAVWESKFSGADVRPVRLGTAAIVRIVRDGVAAEALRIPMAPPTEAEINLVVDDGSNPPLDLKSVTIMFGELPWIYFEAPGPIVARYGNPGATAPRYDLEAVRDSVRIGDVPGASWGEPRRIEAAAEALPPSPMPGTGAPLDRGLFRFQRPISDGPPGLLAVPLDAAVLAHSRGPQSRFADVRVVEGAGRQVPYVLEQKDEPLVVALEPRAATVSLRGLESAAGRARSTYRVTLPYANLPISTLVIETSARVFQRRLEVGIERAADRQRRDPWFERLATTEWIHADQDSPTPALALSLRPLSLTDVIVTVDEGDNSPLPIASMRLLLPTYRVRLFRPAQGSLRLVYGRDDIAAPEYDLALLAPQVMGVEAREVTVAPEGTSASETAAPALITPKLFWILLAVAVVVLLGLIARLMKSPLT